MPLTVFELTDSIDRAFATEWDKRKNHAPLPAGGEEDRKLLFAAVARGVLTYLKAKEDELVGSIDTTRAEEVTTLVVSGAVLNIDQS